jgi:hypothetical protein
MQKCYWKSAYKIRWLKVGSFRGSSLTNFYILASPKMKVISKTEK